MTPPSPPRRPGSKPDLLDSLLDQQPERRSVNHPAVDGVPQAAPRRTATLPQMAALKAPPVIAQTEPGLPAPPAPASAPAPPRLPGELAPTAPAPAAMPWGKTMRAPTPPRLRAQARRSDPPAPPAAAPAPEPSRPPAPPARVPSPAGGTSLPPASQDPGSAAHLAQRRELERIHAERDRAVAELQLERLRAEERAAERELEAQTRLAEQQLEIEKLKAERKPEKFAGLTLRQAFIGLVIAITALGAPLGTYLSVMAGTAKDKADKNEGTTAAVKKTAESGAQTAATTSREVEDLKEQLRNERAYNRELWRLQGVEVPKRPGDPEAPKIETEAPLRRPGKLTRGPQVIVTTPPP